MVLLKNWSFFQLFFLDNILQEMFFMIFYNEKTPFQAIKRRNCKSQKIHLFPKWLTHGFAQNLAIFRTFFFKQYRPGKCVLRYCRTKKNAFLGNKNHKFKKTRNCYFSKGVNPWFLSKIGHFSNFFF